MPTDPHAHFAVFLVALSIHSTLHSPPFLSSFPPFTCPFPGLPKHSTLPPLPHYPWRAPIPSHMSTNANIYHFSKHFRQQLWTTEGLTEKEDETPLSHWGYHHDVFQFVFCRTNVFYRTNVSFEVKQKKPQTFLTLAGKLNLKKDSHCLTLLKIKMLFCHCSSTILFITCIKQSKEKTPFCPRTFPFVI